MRERGLPIVDGAPACPFVAFDDERDERATSPDHRHRCYAETRPAPRALAHQEAYCLSSAFPVCPTFQDWARREAARARPGVPPVAAGAALGGPMPTPVFATAGAAPGGGRGLGGGRAHDDTGQIAMPPAGNIAQGATTAGLGGVGASLAAGPPRGEGPGGPGPVGGSGPGGREDVDAPAFLANRSRGGGLAGSAADRLAGSGEPDAPQPRVVGVVSGGGASSDLPGRDHPLPDAGGSGRARGLDDDFDDDEGWEGGRPAEESVGRRGFTLGGDRRPKVGDTRRRREEAVGRDGGRRAEHSPTLATRMGLTSPTRIGVAVLALVIAAIALFFLPALLGVGNRDDGDQLGAGASPSASAGPSASVAPSPTPAPTPTIYVVKSGDTLFGIAADHGISLEELIEANRETIPDPDNLAIGDQLIIPRPGQSEAPSESPQASAAGSAAP